LFIYYSGSKPFWVTDHVLAEILIKFCMLLLKKKFLTDQIKMLLGSLNGPKEKSSGNTDLLLRIGTNFVRQLSFVLHKVQFEPFSVYAM